MAKTGVLLTITLIVSIFPLLTTIINKDEIKERFDQLQAPENITRVKERGVDEPAIDFNEWQDKIGILRNGVEIAPLAPGIRAVFATRDVKAGEVVIDIPYDAMISEDLVTDDPIILKAQKHLSENKLLAVIIYREMRKPNSKFKPYLNLLPTSLDNFAYFFGEMEFGLIEGTNLINTIRTHINIQKAKYEDVKKALPELSGMTETDFHRAYIHASSRCLNLAIGGRAQYVLIPMFDMLNAYPYTKDEMDSVLVQYKDISSKGRHLEMIAKKDLKKGEEVYDFYRKDFTNTEYLLNYGFVFAEIPDISMEFGFKAKKNDPNYELKKEILSRIPNVFPNPEIVYVKLKNSSREEDYWSLYSTVRVLELSNSKKLEDMLKTFKNEGRKNVGRISKSNEKLAMNNLLSLVKEMLEKHPFTIEEDDMFINEFPLFSTPRNLIQLRREEKIVLKKLITYCETTLAEVSSPK